MFQSVNLQRNAVLVLLLSRTGGMVLVRRLMKYGKGFLNSIEQAAASVGAAACYFFVSDLYRDDGRM